MPSITVSQAETDKRKIVGVNAETVTNVTSTDFPGHYPGEDHTWNLKQFKDSFQVKFYKNDRYDSSFSLVGIDASIANAFRRILLSEIPTLAAEHVFVHNNTSIVQDEVLSHRLGLVPLTGSTAGLKWLRFDKDRVSKVATDWDTVILLLRIECTKNKGAKPGEDDPLKLYHNAHVYARHLQWTPVGRQKDMFPEPDGIIRPTNPDILLAKLRPGQAIDLEIHCVMGLGADHAKFSPVATASYRLLPTINIVKPILGADAKKFARCFPKGVIALKEVTEEEAQVVGSGYEGHAGEKKAVVVNAFKDTVSRECLRHDEFAGKVKLGRVRDHFIFSVESTGQYDSDGLFLESVQTLRVKCTDLKRDLANIMR
ncbi:DNA-directed RNA polymerase core subunit rpc40 [Lambiella insularis]|nr:DNA-directed RNA polymerase core subunit rpc40 [Lambiella insularis]